ncbi:hypothetical protein C7999DRAFT_16005 [Corynascus novoguineensis]|uniref:Uncharacterized protein n=1 Tax=Corynascus novoguineensis TaxID=1126955 RepID=A0AAN7CPT8_9PEZI|nr:hypothetical protein C7999DRAFT_16005 [Corynascus novoguineensis]
MSGFEGLPFELVIEVVQWHCLHCKPARGCQCGEGCVSFFAPCCFGEPACSPSEINARIRALASLCLTSRRLRAAATPHLYHRPDTSKWWLLARTLLGNQRLAESVRRLCVVDPVLEDRKREELFPDPADVTTEIWSCYDARRREVREAAWHDDDDDKDSHSRSRRMVKQVANERAALLVALCPATEVLEADIVYFWPAPYYLSAPGSLLRLVSVELALSVRGDQFTLIRLATLFRAAPNLRTLRCRRIWDSAQENWLGGVTAASVTCIDMSRSVLGPIPLACLLRACPRLETFRFGAIEGSYQVEREQFRPLQARDVMFELGTNLKTVDLRLNYCRMWWSPYHPRPHLWNPQDPKEDKEERRKAVIQSFKERGIALELKIPGPEHW